MVFFRLMNARSFCNLKMVLFFGDQYLFIINSNFKVKLL
ncbi:hypothetical protein LEP1GSC132_1028 [Leptospira kirschneri str. 200803703]|uniref:Uncharacterized protein n=1 Tax=Leptospira kirschneri str. 200802841 TaxID=1193047 RepID=A0A828Y7F8_9LEPT|nr:hypothetical protein LEP1GSC131_0826 [Leptospira kirschneri str. 200802841]EKQ82524.1 hypothetical protein LEP1GSC064_1813 [Leptospira kirschneri serovar Grippotyphosa str. Moskva]EMK04778.1 hypothetical protein LEP1GSC176_2638 [Leptospira kirschneri str. MMD1493]EMK19246.1 hypothetical protein LEP1GSC042_2273 [Leptospira kirschneri serovar Bim str. PUO 1247]EMN25758.1 hypothetical protein LEP1GSC065_3117 [Leptospira kirschneri serovar Sokoine str. RM1]EMO66581.1 hypothetical protein LEP1GS